MSDSLKLLSALAVGVGLGAIYWGGLWWTLRRALASTRPGLWLCCSTLARLSIVLTGMYEVGRGHSERMLLCLVGVVIARVAAVRLARPRDPLSHIRQSISHAP